MTVGVVSDTTTDWRGSTLSAGTSVGTVVLAVEETVDFDEDGGWLVVGDSAPKQYLTCDEDAATVTLAAAVGAVFEAGEPVNIWDPSVSGGGAQVVEYVATVDLADDSGAVDAVIPHSMIPTSGIDYLVGASARLAEADDGEWYVGEVLGRDVRVDPGSIGSPMFRAQLLADVQIAHNIQSRIVDWDVSLFDFSAYNFINAFGELQVLSDGTYLVTVVIKWVNNTSGRRSVKLITSFAGADREEVDISTGVADNGSSTLTVSVPVDMVALSSIRAEVLQTSGAALGVKGDAAGTQTFFRVVRLR